MQRSVTVLYVSPDGPPSFGDDGRRTGPPSGDRGEAALEGSLRLLAASDGADALDRLGNEPVDCAVVEQRPPAFDAFAFAEAVRARDDPVPVLVVAPDVSPERVSGVSVAGSTDVLRAPPGELTGPLLERRVRRLVDGADGDGGPRSHASRGGARPDVEVADGARSIEALRDATRRISAAASTEAVADAVVDVATDQMDVPGVGVFLFDDEANHLSPARMTDALARYYGDDVVFGPGMAKSITWEAFVAGEPEFVDDVASSSRRVNDETDARATAFVPLGDHGVLVAAAERAGIFDGSRRELALLLGDLAASALDRVALSTAVDEREDRLRALRRRFDRRERTGDLLRSTVRALVDADGRDDLERRVLDPFLDDERVSFAWIGTFDHRTRRVEPRRWAGDGSGYLDSVALAADASGEPAVRAAATGEVAVAANVARSMAGGDWERTALARDFHSVVGVPLCYRGVLYGVLGVYAGRPDAFDDFDVAALADLGDAIAYAVNAAEATAAARSPGGTELELRVVAPGDPLNGIVEAVGSPIRCLDVHPRSEGTVEICFSVTDSSVADVTEATADLVAVADVRLVGGEDAPLYRATVDARTVPAVVATFGATPREVVADGDAVTVTLDLPDALDARSIVSRLSQRYRETELLARRDRDPDRRTRAGFRDELDATLTERQLEVLRTAHELGFFDSPRRATGEDVAAALDVSQPTISHHLREGQGRLFSLLFDED